MVSGDVLIENAQRLHTTELGAERIRRNLGIETPDVVAWCRARIIDRAAKIGRRGKNWYVECGGCRITVNAGSYTIITAHPIGRSRKQYGKTASRTETRTKPETKKITEKTQKTLKPIKL